ncbi:MAG: CocE/NonD family hydrolase, partial [Chloroflexota bacterium]
MQNKNKTTGQRIKTIGLGLLILISLALLGGFLYVPTLFQAPYEGPTITTEDGKELVTFVRLPEGKGPFPTIIVRSPYELPHTPLSGMEARDFTNVPAEEIPYAGWQPITEAGYALVIQHTRGRVGSEGLALDLTDRQDSVELIEWVKAQPWSNGKIGTTGDSIEAILAMLTNAEYPEGVDASFVQNGSPNMVSGMMLEGGALKL